MRVVVIGGGFVGQMVQLQIPSARLLDWRRSAPENHLDTRVGPQYLWEPIPNIPSTSFEVTTLVDGVEPTPERIRRYKQKIGKENDGGDWGLQFQYKMTGWHSQLPVPRVEYNRRVSKVSYFERLLVMADGSHIPYDLLINTVPFTALLDMLTPHVYVEEPFKYDPIYMEVQPSLNTEKGMVLNYISNPDVPWYRITRFGGYQYREALRTPLAIPQTDTSIRRLMPGKIHPHESIESVLKDLATFGVYCFGRYAAWRPDELAHETWKAIEHWKEVGLWT